ncbi:hypothetical protein BCV71DRAFT_289264 [Rhizopus microsporus]|uniref:Uncharacterized protein n=1 Tax=Rhizopus microsporus TaxID=58291 RepID=A0A1X0S9F5_RHIZD|nr:hypothetical protein BCV71DRAFT_289264 [Rhizopus microsporus]
MKIPKNSAIEKTISYSQDNLKPFIILNYKRRLLISYASTSLTTGSLSTRILLILLLLLINTIRLFHSQYAAIIKICHKLFTSVEKLAKSKVIRFISDHV